ncbi:MAG: endolytic transglycosylase MltG [Gammaproteobacteria bacterium]|nr:endolytic transglycosylase MltG [Gammaproteobacteria bacterium]
MVYRLFKKMLLWGLFIFAIAISILIFEFQRFQHETVSIPGSDRIFTIKSGSNIKTIAQQLSMEKIIDDPWLFILLAKFKGVETRVRAGEYRLQATQSPVDLLELFTKGQSIQYSFTIIEGWTFREMLHQMQTHSAMTNSLEDKTDAEIMTLLGYPGQHPEGLFFPDTYRFPKHTSDIKFLQRAYKLMQTHLQREWQNRAPDLPVNSSYEALILASIIEKETGVASERPLIASVFTRRLKKNMRLQTDPTIIYGLGESFDGDIRYRDLKKDTPYNTYLHAGLTPTPIALPGLESIRAALHPADSDALYFVARGDGTHQFSGTLEAHNKAVKKYQLGK